MPKAMTYKLVSLKNPSGLSIDALVIFRNKRRPVTFNKVGETVDIRFVDIPSFAKSACTGDLLRLEQSGVLRRVEQEVSEDLLMSLTMELAKYPDVVSDIPSTPARVIVLEPGLTVVVGDGVIPRDSQRPTAKAPLIQPAMVQDPSLESTQAGARQDPLVATSQSFLADMMQSAVDGIPAKVEEPSGEAPTWKTGKSYQEQVEIVKSSSDIKFLKTVASDKLETKKIVNVAQRRIKELGQPVGEGK